MKKEIILIFLALSAIIISCNDEKMSNKIELSTKINKISPSTWHRLAEKRIYFGHQSVGQNIIEGIEDLKKEYPQIKLNIIELEKDNSDLTSPGLYHSPIGENTKPRSKIAHFSGIAKDILNGKADIALFKFCYIDVTPNTNVKELFEDYKQTIDQLKNDYPEIKFVNVTMPLVRVQTGPRAWIKKILGKPITGIEDNIKRGEFNQLMRQEYEGKEPIFDLAKIESTFPDGSRLQQAKGDATFYALVPEFTYDDGHLNEVGRRQVAAEFVSVLAQVSMDQTR